jgi:hypothetical protein
LYVWLFQHNWRPCSTSSVIGNNSVHVSFVVFMILQKAKSKVFCTWGKLLNCTPSPQKMKSS